MYIQYKIFYSSPGGEFLAHLGRIKQRINARLYGHFKQLLMHNEKIMEKWKREIEAERDFAEK